MSSVYMQHDDDNAPCLCTNCGTTTPFVQLNAIDDIEQRISPGDEVPAGECPECGCLAYLVKPKAWTVLLRRVHSDDPGSTYLAHVESDDAKTAEAAAVREAIEADGDTEHCASDYETLLVIQGKHQDMTP